MQKQHEQRAKTEFGKHFLGGVVKTHDIAMMVIGSSHEDMHKFSRLTTGQGKGERGKGGAIKKNHSEKGRI